MKSFRAFIDFILRLLGLNKGGLGIDYEDYYRPGTELGDHYAQRVAFFQDNPSRLPKIFLGDSNTEGWRVPPNFLAPLGIQERGIAGDMTWGVLQRIDQHLEEDPTKIYLMIGTNDLGAGATVEQLIANYRAILDAIPGPIRVYCVAIPPINTQIMKANSIDTASTTRNIQEANRRIEALCRAAPPYRVFIDGFHVLADHTGSLRSELTSDGLHLNEQGRRVLSALLPA